MTVNLVNTVRDREPEYGIGHKNKECGNLRRVYSPYFSYIETKDKRNNININQI